MMLNSSRNERLFGGWQRLAEQPSDEKHQGDQKHHHGGQTVHYYARSNLEFPMQDIHQILHLPHNQSEAVR